jgi:protein CMS1
MLDILILLNPGALSTKDLERVVIDASHIDQKKRGILDMKDTALQLIQFLTQPDLKEKYSTEADDKGVELLFF